MSLWRFILPLDHRSVVQHLGAVLRLLAMLFVVPVAVALVAREFEQAAVLVGIAVAGAVLGWLLGRGPLRDLALREALVVTALTYPLAALLGAPAFLSVAAPVDAVFESMSGFTTTGLTVMDDLDLPRSLLFLRAYSQWLGGAGIVVVSLVVLAGAGSAAAKLYSSEFGQENLLGSVRATARVVLAVYGGLTLAAGAALVTAGAGWFDGLLHALALVSTGGFSPFAGSIGAYQSDAVATVTILFMLLGAISFPLYYLAVRDGWRRFLRDAQLRLLLALVAAGTLVVALLEGLGDLGVLFHVTSAVTTTGYTLGDPADWSGGTRLVAMGLMVVGGSAGSTAGGLKLLRTLMLFLLGGWAITRMMLPREAKVPLEIGHVAVSEDDLRRAFALLVTYGSVLFVSALSLTAAGFPVEQALFEVTSATGTVGLSVGVTGPELPAWGKLVLAVDMWLGRVEVLPVLVLLHPRTWRRKKEEKQA